MSPAEVSNRPGGTARRLHWQLVVLVVAVLLIHLPSLRLGRLRDDLYVLGKCETLSFSQLLLQGFRFPRQDFGNAWWVPQDDIAHFFRPLVIATFKIPMALLGRSDVLQHLLNLILHLSTTTLILLLGWRLFRNPSAALLGALFYALSLHNQWTVLWISGRKELLVGFLTFFALYSHITGRRWRAAVLFVLALMAGEHAVALPFLVVVWDLFMPRSGVQRPGLRAICGHCWRSWALFGILLVVYVVGRHIALGGMPLPVPPYFNHPLEPGFVPYAVLKKVQFATALALHVLFVDRPVMALWLDNPWLLALSVVLTVAVLLWYWAVARSRRLYLLFLGLALVAYAPFTPMTAAPIYLYSPTIYFSLAVGTALDGVFGVRKRNRTGKQRGLLFFVMAAIALHWCGGLIWSYGPFNQRVTYPLEVLPRVMKLIEGEDPRRPLLFVDMPYRALSLPYLLHRATGRPTSTIAVASPRVGRIAPEGARVERLGPRSLRITDEENPYFEHPIEKFLCFVPEGVIAQGKTIHRGWLDITIERVGPGPARDATGHRFFTKEPGVVALRLDVEAGTPLPIVIAYRNLEPFVVRGLFEE